jgi:putative ABC transport system substrate-binding protein
VWKAHNNSSVLLKQNSIYGGLIIMNAKNIFCAKTRRGPAVFVCAVLVILLLCSCSSKPKVYHVGILTALQYFYSTADGFKKKMAELGYAEGTNIIYDIRKTPAEGDEEIQQIIKKFIDDKADLIVVSPTKVALKAKAATRGTKIPVVFASAFIEGNDLIENVRQPGGNITGVRWPSGGEFEAKSLEILHEILPQVKRVWITYQEDYPGISEQLETLSAAAGSTGITLVRVPVKTVEGIQADLKKREKPRDTGMDAILLMSEPLGSSENGFAAISKFAIAHRIPVVGIQSDTTIFSYAPDPLKSGGQAAYLSDKILKGTQAGSIPILTVENSLVIFYKVIKNLGLSVSEATLSKADSIVR